MPSTMFISSPMLLFMNCSANQPAMPARVSGHGYSLGQYTSGVAQPDGVSSAHRVARTACAYLIWSSFRQIRNCSCKIGVVDQLKTAIAAALTGFGVGSVFRVRDKRLSCFRRRKLPRRNKGGIQRLAFQRLHVPAACQVLAAMFVHNVVHGSRVCRHPPIVSYLDACDHVNSHCPYLL